MFARLAPGSLANRWVANSSAIRRLQLSVPVGTAGSHIPVLTKSNGQFRILTRPALFTEKVPALGSQGDIGFVHDSASTSSVSVESGARSQRAPGIFEGHDVLPRAAACGRAPKLRQAITPLNGSTMSPFVTLAKPR